MKRYVLAFKHAYVLTGSIASGKSTVSKLLKSQGFTIIDADVIAREQLALHVKEVQELFGSDICDDGVIDRTQLAKIIFNSKEEREKLNKLLHPLIRQEIRKMADTLDALGSPYIMDIPLYFESGEYECKMNVVVYAPMPVQLSRLIKRDAIEKEEAQKRINSQMNIDKKRDLADWVIDNSFDVEHLKEETQKFIDFVRNDYAHLKV